MASLRFTKDHEYVCLDGDVATIGITDYAQKQLGDVVFVELPDVGAQLVRGKQAAIVESVKAASEVYAPLTGVVVAVNEALPDTPSLVNSAPLAGGWFLKMTLAHAGEIDALMSEGDYDAYVETLG